MKMRLLYVLKDNMTNIEDAKAKFDLSLSAPLGWTLIIGVSDSDALKSVVKMTAFRNITTR